MYLTSSIKKLCITFSTLSPSASGRVVCWKIYFASSVYCLRTSHVWNLRHYCMHYMCQSCLMAVRMYAICWWEHTWGGNNFPSSPVYLSCPDTVVAMKVDSRNTMGHTHILNDNPFALNTSLHQHSICCLKYWSALSDDE